MKTLFPHQELAIVTLRKSLAGGFKRPLLQAPTGAGKTVIAAAIINMALAKGRRVIFTVPAIELIDQTVRAFWAEGIRDVGVIQASHPMTDASKPVQIASIQTLQRRKIPATDLVLIDEAHRMFEFVTDWMGMDEWASVPFIGLSATPWARGLGRLYDKLIIAATTEQLIGDGFLAPFRVFAPSHPDLTGVRTLAGDYHEGDLSKAMGKGTLTADIVATWLAHGEGRPTLCFAVDRAHAASIQREFQAAGVPCGYVDANTTKEDREVVRKAFLAGDLKVVCNVGVLTTGVDWDVRCIILARPTKSEMLYVQIIGRGLRTAAGKADCLVLDHSDTTLKLGFVTDIHHGKLNDGKIDEAGKREFQEPKPRECGKCSRLMPPRIGVCPSCGFKAERKSDVEVQAGELIELDGRRKPKPAEKAKFYSELLGYARTNGKTDKWALATFRARYTEWPHGKNTARALPPSPETVSYIRSRQIAWAKGQQKRFSA